MNEQKPNIIYILADDMGYGDVSAYNPDCPFCTPHLDNMCAEGIRFTDAHAASAVCTPSRYSVLTGRYSWRSVLKSYVVGGYSAPIIEKNRTTVADLLKAQGYKTCMIGKWHLGMDFPKTPEFFEREDFAACDGIDYCGTIKQSPTAYGFEYFFGISGSLDMPPYVYIENDRFTAIPDTVTQSGGKKFWRRGPTAPGFVHENVLDELTDKVCEKIREYKDSPFFIYFPLPAPHTPILPAKQFQGKSGTNEYGDFVLHCDDVVGRVQAQLKKYDLSENTILIFTSDNGCSPMADYEELAQKGHNPSYVFRGTKADIYEGGHRVPCIVRWPACIRGNRISDALVCLSDLMATIADILGITLKDNEGEDSVSNYALWKEERAEVRTDTVHQSIDGSLSLRQGRWKLEMCPGSGGWSYPQPGKEDKTSPRFQLYDLQNDIGEKINIIKEHPDIAAELRKRLIAYILNGRSTPGKKQKNNGRHIWDAITWIDESDLNL
ncbi:arylsulfatase [Treponema sp. OMZ 840]|uniref:sulfatase family protein n=1 Tax=Treponema sp. OMZ 840 TaxID=244313 RepID=UPI003D8FE990